MEYKYVANIKELFAKLRVFNVITDVDTFSSIPGDYGEISLKFNNGKQEFLTEVLHETLLNLNYKLLERIVKNEYQVFNWQFVYPRYKRLQVIMSDTKVTMRFPKNQSAYEFFNWVDDICKNAVLVRGDAEEKYQELENLHNLLQEQETDHGIVEQIGFEDHHPVVSKEKTPVVVQDKPLNFSWFSKFQINYSAEEYNFDFNQISTINGGFSELCSFLDSSDQVNHFLC